MSKKKIIIIAVVSIVVIVGIYFGVQALIYGAGHQTTDNAQIEGDISPIVSRVDGYIGTILVDDNTLVEKGQLIATIDTSDLSLRVDEQRAALSGARVDSADAEANLAYQKTLVQQAQIAIKEKRDDLTRQEGLMNDGATTQQNLDHAQSAFKNAVAKKESAQKQVDVARVKVKLATVNIQKAQVALKNANLQLSYSQIRAPMKGTVSELNIELGQLVRSGQVLMQVVDKNVIYVIANYKESQIGQIRVGQKVAVEVDAYKDRTFDGIVQSINGATGSKFALLPADNASGNFVKVEQRIPVKIVFTGDDPDLKYLKPGMNVVPAIEIPKKDRDDRE